MCSALLTAAVLLACETASVRAAEVAFDLKIDNGKVPPNMRLIRVKQGDSVKLRWTTDRPIMLHLHGYDIEKKVDAGGSVSFAFPAKIGGVFEVELEDRGVQIASLKVEP